MLKYKEKSMYLSERSKQKKFSTVVGLCNIQVSNSQHKLGDILLLLVFHLNLWRTVWFSRIFFQ